MSLLDPFIEDTALHMGLGHRARRLVEVLVDYIRSLPGGVEGLRHRFEQAGMGEQFPAGNPPHRLLASQLERIVGRAELVALARRAAFPTGMFAVVAADLLPGLIDVMEREAALAANEPAAVAERLVPSTVPRSLRGSALRGALWVLIAGVLLCLTGWIHQKTRAPAGTAAQAAAVAAAERHQMPRLTLVVSANGVDVRGRLPSEADRRRVWNALVAQYGRTRVGGDIQRDHHTQSPRWLDRLLTVLPSLNQPGLALSFSGDALNADLGRLPEAERVAVSETLRRAFGHLPITGLWDPGRVALSQLPEQHDAEQLASALNQGVVRFAHKSPELRADSMDTLRASALAIRRAGPRLRLEVGSHTDSLGTSDSNLRLSQQRAEAVVAELRALGVPSSALVARGYGEDHPVADNRLEAGRERNRRIVYTVLD
ncbi:OmpA family protein [Stenotrophomonas sp.]|uniref:OmpA family protein n=1 Tax=Stenotrophomonas sp. TaxID=69392 RepID=UPI00289DE442|nr:OmpA family protein [Stenotrophomonas sp.]